MNHPNLADNYTCTGCMACVDTCPKGALSSKWNDEGHLSVACDASKCVLCHQCEKVCPVVSSFNYSTDGNSEFFAAWNKDDNQRRNSSSGGAFSAIATFILKKGGYVVGASNEGVCDIKHIIIHDLSELCKIQGSKYTQSNTTGIYKKTFNLLKDGELVLFSGTGCQVAGLLSYVKHKKYAGKLITIDLVCGGVPSHLLIKKFIENEPYKVKKIISFRSKEHGWKSMGFSYNLLVEDEKGQIHDYSGIKNLITDGFSRDMTERYSCYDCHFNGSNRISDFTIGDLWGDKDYPEQHKQGLSLIIVHNEQSRILLSSMNKFLQIEPTDKVRTIDNNLRIVNGYNVKSHLYERKHLPWIFEHLSYKTLKHVYANDISRYSPWMLYKIWRKIRIEILKFNHKLKVRTCRKLSQFSGGYSFGLNKASLQYSLEYSSIIA